MSTAGRAAGRAGAAAESSSDPVGGAAKGRYGPHPGDRLSRDGGQWSSPYDGTAHTSPSTRTIDHLVSLKEAWISGASRWTPERRRTFAHDQEHSQLLSVSVSSDSPKGERPPNVWLPATSQWCTYARSWIHTKHIHHLSVTDPEYGSRPPVAEGREQALHRRFQVYPRSPRKSGSRIQREPVASSTRGETYAHPSCPHRYRRR